VTTNSGLEGTAHNDAAKVVTQLRRFHVDQLLRSGLSNAINYGTPQSDPRHSGLLVSRTVGLFNDCCGEIPENFAFGARTSTAFAKGDTLFFVKLLDSILVSVVSVRDVF